MNLFISDNFIDTVGQNVNVVQLIQQIAEDDDLLQVEILSELAAMFDYGTNGMEEAIKDGEFDDILLLDDTLYVGGEVLRDLFEALYPGDHTVVINALITSIANSGDTTLRLDHNCTPVVEEHQEVQQTIDFSKLSTVDVRPHAYGKESPNLMLGEARTVPVSSSVPEGHVVTGVDDNEMTVRPVEVLPFPAAEEVLRPEVAVLNSEAVLGELKVNGCVIPVRQVIGKNGVLFSVDYLYSAVYNLQHDPDYLRQILVEYRSSLDSEDVLFANGSLYLTVYGLAKLHGRLCHLIEWQPLVAKIVNQFTLNPYDNVSFDLLGNQVG
ncbi:hypothetical protein DRD23_09585 [Salmonella enterica subsp. enterica serovar Enteritidis]|nr:hypothetical protein [Salmonella enterica subsp. enterica serovar Enteritidis]